MFWSLFEESTWFRMLASQLSFDISNIQNLCSIHELMRTLRSCTLHGPCPILILFCKLILKWSNAAGSCCWGKIIFISHNICWHRATPGATQLKLLTHSHHTAKVMTTSWRCPNFYLNFHHHRKYFRGCKNNLI